MKKFLLTLTAIFICTIAYAHTINWHVGNTILETTTCDSGDSITPPTAPYKYGYHFKEWAEYIPIEYLESTGTQYIDTGFAFTENLSRNPFVVDFNVAPTTLYKTTGNIGIFAGANNYVMVSLQYRWDTVKNFISMRTTGDIVDGPLAIDQIKQPVHLRYEYNKSLGTFSVTGDAEYVNVPFKNDGVIKTSTNNIYLFKCNGCSDKTIPIRIYRWIYESNGVKIRDFIPVLDKDGVPCMYDKVEGKFYYNAGTGQFIAGPVIGE